ncbi:MAG: efflux RND transporter permease subunit [Phycisphaeraceae bacterium]|nr:efflux RND transporter permease subunit [Phycisphaeraceae bacterium]
MSPRRWILTCRHDSAVVTSSLTSPVPIPTQEERGAAVVSAGSIRLRPILMTTSTTVLGMTPLALGLGSGAEIMRPLALCVIGGLLVSMLLTLFVIPCLYLIVSAFAERLKAALLARQPAPARSPTPPPSALASATE